MFQCWEHSLSHPLQTTSQFITLYLILFLRVFHFPFSSFFWYLVYYLPDTKHRCQLLELKACQMVQLPWGSSKWPVLLPFDVLNNRKANKNVSSTHQNVVIATARGWGALHEEGSEGQPDLHAGCDRDGPERVHVAGIGLWVIRGDYLPAVTMKVAPIHCQI